MTVDTRMNAFMEDLAEAETPQELEALIATLEGGDLDYLCDLRVVDELLRPRLGVLQVFSEEPQYKAPRLPVTRTSKVYRLLSTNVAWSSKPQVHSMMHILSAHLGVGDEVEESDIVQMMVQNEHVLETKQGGKKIWDYYKGNTTDGLLAHGNVEVVK